MLLNILRLNFEGITHDLSLSFPFRTIAKGALQYRFLRLCKLSSVNYSKLNRNNNVIMYVHMFFGTDNRCYPVPKNRPEHTHD